MTAPTTTARDACDWLTGPTDDATQAWIDASVAQYEQRRRQVEDACTGEPKLLIGRADYRQVSAR